jgi:hypothetical protein
MNAKSRINIFLSGIILIISMSFFVYYSNSAPIFKLYGFELKKNKDLSFYTPKKKKAKVVPPKIIVEKKNLIDTSSKRFLLIGDSEIEGLRNPFYDYCKKNGHELALAMIWYSSTDMTYANSDTLKKIIGKYKPNHIVMTIGLNQIYQTSFDGSEQAIDKIIETFDTIPYSWIGPANWTEDKGINNLYQNKIDSGKFFLSKNLILERAKDGRHPSNNAYFIWMDSIANWMQNKSTWKIKMNRPDSLEKSRKINVITLTVGKKSQL